MHSLQQSVGMICHAEHLPCFRGWHVSSSGLGTTFTKPASEERNPWRPSRSGRRSRGRPCIVLSSEIPPLPSGPMRGSCRRSGWRRISPQSLPTMCLAGSCKTSDLRRNPSHRSGNWGRRGHRHNLSDRNTFCRSRARPRIGADVVNHKILQDLQ